MHTKIAGGILLIVGTAIGAGMLALPLVSAQSGLLPTTLMLLFCWVIMTFSGFLLLEVNLWFPPRNNLITMAKKTLGTPGAILSWVSYLLLLYSLLAAYISGGTDLFRLMTTELGLNLSLTFNAILFVVVFGFIVFRGIQPVDYVNRGLMMLKFGSLFILICFAIPHIKKTALTDMHPSLVTAAITVMITSFSFSNIIPSLRSYFQEDLKKLRLAILIGSFIPLVCYLLWDFAVLGVIPRDGEKGLLHILQQGGSISELSDLLSYHLNNASITGIIHLFTSICLLTSFLCVSLSLSDFLADGLQIEKVGKGNWIANVLTFLPPLLIVIFFQHIFVLALSYAGIFCMILLVLLPAVMVLRGRYQLKLSEGHYRVFGGFLPVVAVILIAVWVIVLAFR